MKEETIKKLLITKFIKENNRAPLDFEINDLIKEVTNKTNINFGYWTNTLLSTFFNSFSAESFNNFLLESYYNNLDNLEELEEQYLNLSLFFNDFLSYSHILESKLTKLNLELSSTLLKGKYNSNLLYSISENFSNLSKIITENTTALITSSGATNNLTIESDLKEKINSLSYNVYSLESFISTSELSNINNIIDLDNNFFAIEASSNNKTSTYLEISINLFEKTFISKINIKFEKPIDSITILTKQGQNSLNKFKTISVSTLDTTLIDLNLEIDQLNIVLFKKTNDYISDNNYISLFKIDYIGLYESSTNTTQLYCGPYSFTNLLNEPINFSQVTLETCETNNDNSWLNHYISVDNDNWIPISPVNKNTGGSLIQLSAVTNSTVFDIINEDINDNKLLSTNTILINKNDIGILNKTLSINYLDKLDFNLISFKRNIPNSSNIFDIESGWFYNIETNEYQTTFFIDSLDSIILDFGYTSAYIDNIIATGKTTVFPGYHVFRTDATNYLTISDSLNSESLLKTNDSLYPYNHKYLIQGYNYPSTYSGNKVYNGIKEYFGSKLKYLDYSIFETSNSLDYYSIITDDNFIYFLIKTKKGYTDYLNEIFELNILFPLEDNNLIYLRTDFMNTDNSSSSTLHSFTIRAI